MEKTSSEGQAAGAGGSSTWEAFLRAEENWSRLKQSKAFEYDPKHLKSVQDGVPPPPQFVIEDGASGNARAWAKLLQGTRVQDVPRLHFLVRELSF